MYLRGPGFVPCLQVFVDHGLQFDQPALLAVLLDDGEWLKKLIASDPSLLKVRVSLDCCFTPLEDATLLHVCAEYNSISAAAVLLDAGADVDALAGFDADGFGGHTPIFHAVNQHRNYCLPICQLLLEHGANLDLTVKGLIWGKGYEWETFIPSVNPISYAMMGLLRQFQRSEEDIYETVSILMRAQYGIDYRSGNVPNKYLRN
jgi:ankyrin repeat protein